MLPVSSPHRKPPKPYRRSLARHALLWMATVLALAALPLTGRSTPPTGAGPLLWADEFTGTALDTTHWVNYDPGTRNDAVNVPQAVSVGNGILTISTYTASGKNYTGMISTVGKFQQTYGYFEARARFDSSPGQWSAFWVQSPSIFNTNNDPAHNGVEMDIMEGRAVDPSGKAVDNVMHSALHWNGYGTTEQSAGYNQVQPGLAAGTWHTYGMLWSPQGCTFYFDDQVTWTTAAAISQISQYIVLSSEVHTANWAGTMPAAGYGAAGTSTTDVQFDYVRVYGFAGSNPVPAVTSAPSAGVLAGTAFSYQTTATQLPTNYTASGLPGGLAIAADTGVISGVPTTAGTYPVGLGASNAYGNGTAALTITVQAPTTYSTWESAYFTSAEMNNPAVSGPNATPASDGIGNLLKYALNLDPKVNGVSGLPVQSVVASGGSSYLALTYTRLIPATDVTCAVEVSGDLQTWSSGAGATVTVSAVTSPDGKTQTVAARDLTPISTSGARARFIRLKVSSP